MEGGWVGAHRSRRGTESADGKGGHKSAGARPIIKAAQDGQFDPGFVIRLNQFLKQSSLAMEPLGAEKRCQITAASLATINIRPPRSQHPLLPFSPAASQPPPSHSSTFHPQPQKNSKLFQVLITCFNPPSILSSLFSILYLSLRPKSKKWPQKLPPPRASPARLTMPPTKVSKLPPFHHGVASRSRAYFPGRAIVVQMAIAADFKNDPALTCYCRHDHRCHHQP